MSRPDLLALTPASVAALANLGLVKRAQREIESGKAPALEEDAAGVVTGRFDDGVMTSLPPGVPLRDAPCSCGAATICRHRVAVVLAYPAWHAENASPLSRAAAIAKAPANEIWSPEIFDDDALGALVGKRNFTRAQALAKAGLVVELEGGSTPSAKLPTCSVKFHVPRDLAYARCDCQTAVGCEHVVLAAWAFRRAGERGLAPPCTVELAPAAKTARVKPRQRRAESSADAPSRAPSAAGGSSIEEALCLVEHVLAEGVSHASDADKPRFAHVRIALGKAGHLWAAALVDELERSLEAYRARSARYRTADVVFAAASLEARARSAARGGELPARFVLGSDEARETALDHVRLLSLGARVVADGDRRDASVYLADPDSGVVLVATREFAPPAPPAAPRAKTAKVIPEDGPALARRMLTGKVTLGALARGQVVTRAAKRQANHELTLGTSRTSQTSVAPSSGELGCLPPGLLFSDLDALRRDLKDRPPRILRPRTLAARMKVIALAAEDPVRELAYHPGDQELVAVLATPNGDRLHLVRRHTQAGPFALDAIVRALGPGGPPPRFVAGDIHQRHGVLELDPTAIVTDRMIVPDLEPEPPAGDGGLRVAGLPVLATRTEGAIEQVLARAASVLEEAAHDGLSALRTGFADRATSVAEAFGAVGLGGPGTRLEALAAAVRDRRAPASIAAAWLDAAIRLELVREAFVAS